MRIFGVLGVFVFASIVSAQVEQGVLLGTVADQSSARIGGALITMTNQGTNTTTVTRTDAAGSFRSIPLRAGTYSIAVEAAGFK